MASEFVKIRCPECENEKVVFRKASTEIQCEICGSKLADPTGGKTKLLGQIVESVNETRSDSL